MNSMFDDIADSYDKELKESLGLNDDVDIGMFAEYKIKILKAKLSKMPVNILEFGCGTGRNGIFMKKMFPESNLYGCDISEKSLEIAGKTNPDVRYNKIINPVELIDVYKEEFFDCIFISNVFHHIPFNEHHLWLDVLYKITSKDGIIFIFEHNPYNPIIKHIFNKSSIDKGAVMLKPPYCKKLFQKHNFKSISRNYTLFFMWRNTFFEFIERMLCWLPMGAQYYIRSEK